MCPRTEYRLIEDPEEASFFIPKTDETINQDSAFLLLPNELLDCVASFSGPVGLACFSLTCKRLYSRLEPRARVVWQNFFRSDHLDFLLLLEDDQPDLLLCHVCLKLFKWRVPKSGAENRSRFQPKHRLCPNHAQQGHHRGMSICGEETADSPQHFYRETKDLILRFYRKGTDYGLPIQYIQHTCRGAHPMEDQESIKTELTPLIVKGNLLARRIDSLVVNLDQPRLRGNLIRYFQHRICPHISSPLPAIILCQIEAMLHCWDDGFEFPPDVLHDHTCRDLMHCWLCKMDFKVAVEAKSDRTATITVSAWYHFGDRRSKRIDPERLVPRTMQVFRYFNPAVPETSRRSITDHPPSTLNRFIAIHRLWKGWTSETAAIGVGTTSLPAKSEQSFQTALTHLVPFQLQNQTFQSP
jgi:hypothetical protein